MMGADSVQTLPDHELRQLGPVAFTAQMSQINLLQISRDDFLGRAGGSVIGKVAMPAENPLFKAPGTTKIVLKHLHIVVGFEDQKVSGTDTLNYKFGRMPEIGEEANVATGRSKQESDRVVGVVRDAESIDHHVTGVEGGACGEKMKRRRRFELQVDGFARQAIAIDGHIDFARKGRKALSVIRMLVRDKNSGQILDGSADRKESSADLASTEAGVDQQTGLIGFNISAVATGTAAQDRDVHSHDSQPRERLPSGQSFSD